MRNRTNCLLRQTEEYLPATATQTEYVYTRTVYPFISGHPCFRGGPLGERDALPPPPRAEARDAVRAPEPAARAAVVHARAPVSAPTPPAANLAPRANPPQCLKPWSGSADAVASACSCIAVGNPTTTSHLPDETLTIEADKTQPVDSFKIFRFPDRYVKSTPQGNQLTPFVCPECEGIGVYGMDAYSDLGACALINEYYQYAYVVQNENYLVKFMSQGTANSLVQNEGYQLSPVLCRVYTEVNALLICESNAGGYDKTYVTADNQQVWQMENVGDDEIYLYAEPWSMDVPRS